MDILVRFGIESIAGGRSSEPRFMTSNLAPPVGPGVTEGSAAYATPKAAEASPSPLQKGRGLGRGVARGRLSCGLGSISADLYSHAASNGSIALLPGRTYPLQSRSGGDSTSVNPETALGINRKERSPAEPETRNPKLEIRNKAKLMGMGQWANGKAQCFFASCEQSRLLQCKERIERNW